MALLSLASFMAALDSTILVTILPVVARDLHGSSIDSFWAGTSYLLSSALAQPFIASLSEVFGPRWPLFFSVALFGIGSFVCGLVPRVATLLTGRFIQGLGGGGIITLVQVIFVELVPLRQRPKWFATVLISWAVGSVLGPFAGSLLMSSASLRWVFWINLPFCGIILVVTIILMDTKSLEISLLDAFGQIDWIGACLFITGSSFLLIGLSWGGVEFAWTSKWTLMPITIGGFGILSTILWERYMTSRPFIRRSMFPNSSAILGYLGAMLHGLILFCTLYYVPFYFASVKLRTPIESSICVLPISCSLLPSATIVSYLIGRTGAYRWAIWSGWMLTSTGAGLLLLLDKETKASVWATIFVVFGFGNGSLLSAINFGIQSACMPQEMGRAAATYTFFRSSGMPLGVTIGGNVFLNTMLRQLQDFGLPDYIAYDAEAYLEVLQSSDNADIVIAVYCTAFRGVFLVLLICSACGLVTSSFLKHNMMRSTSEVEEADSSISMTD